MKREISIFGLLACTLSFMLGTILSKVAGLINGDALLAVCVFSPFLAIGIFFSGTKKED